MMYEETAKLEFTNPQSDPLAFWEKGESDSDQEECEEE